MLETILERPSTLKRHRDVPLLKEREEFLQRLHQQGTSRAALRNLASELIHVVRLLRLGKLRDVSPEEIHRAAERFAGQQLSNPKAHSYVRAASYFAYVAKKWLRFLGRLKPLSVRRARFADRLEDFAQYMALEQGLSPQSIQGSQDILLGKPIIHVTHNDVFDETRTRQITEVLAEWIALDRENIVNRHAGLYWVGGPLRYETGKPIGRPRGVSFYWHPQNLTECALNLGRSAMALWRVLHHQGATQFVTQAPWKEGVSPLRELLLWTRDVDPSLRGLLDDIEKK